MPDAGAVWVDVLPDLKKFGPRLRAELKKHADKGMNVPVGLDTAAARTPRVRVSADTRSALANLAGVSKAADRLDGRIINMRVATTGAGPVAPSAPTPTPSGGSSGAGGGGGSQRPFTDISPAGVAAITTMLPPLVPAVGALAGGLGAVASGFTAAGVGAAAFTLAAVPAIRDATTATGELTAEQEQFRASLGGMTASWRQFRAETDGPVLEAATSGVDAANIGLAKLTPSTLGTARALGILGQEAENGLGNPRWSAFFDFLSRQATPSTLIFGRSLGNLGTGVAGLVMNMEPLWNVVGPGLEDMSARFAAWGHDSEGFTDFIAWTIENGPTFLGFFGQIAETAIDVGVAIAPLGTVYAQGLTILAGAISAVAETAPWLIQVAIAAKTAQVAFGLLGRVNTGLIQPMRELPGHIREYATSLSNVAPAADGAAGGTNRFKGALGGVMGALGGPWGIAIAAGVTALGIFIAQKAEAEQKIRDYTEAVRADTGAIGENTRAAAVNALETEGILEMADRYGLSLNQVTDAATGNTEALDSVTAEIDRQIESYQQMETVGAADRARQEGHIERLEKIRDALGGENEAINEASLSYQRSTEAMGETQAAQDGVNASLAEGAFQARDLKTALDELTGAHVGAVEAESGFQAAVDRATESIATNGQTLDENTEAGRANLDALSDLRDTTNTNTEAVKLNGDSVAETIQTHERGRKKFIEVAQQMGATAEEAEDLADEYLGIPADVESRIRLSATGEWSVPYSSDTGAGTNAGGGLSFYAEGGPVYGPGTATSDSIDARLSNGEFVQRTAAVNKYGVGFMSALNEGRVPREALPGFAKGGWATKGAGSAPWDILDDHRQDVRPNYNRMVWELIDRVGDTMGDQWKNSTSGPMGVVKLAEASIGKYPESNGNNTNDITSWFGMNGAPWCAMFISWLFSQAGASKALGGASHTAWTGDYYTSGMAQTRNPQPGDVAVYGTKHVNLVTAAGGGRRVGGNQSNNVTAGPYSGGTIFRPNWGFADGGLVSIADIMSQDRKEDERAGLHPVLRGVQDIAGLATGGLASGWTVVGEEGPELARFDDPARIYSTQESARMLATAGTATAQGGSGAGAGPLVGQQTFNIHSAEHALREAVQEMTHGLRVARKGGVYADA